MAFTFKEYGTFTGPGTNVEFRDNDDFSLDPFEGYTEFNLNDVAMALISSPTSPVDFVYLHLDGSNTDTVTLERNNAGPIPNFIINSDDVYVSGNLDCVPSGRLLSRIEIADSLPKPFDMVHPSLGEGHRLRYACIEGPEVAIYFRGRTKTNVIDLPWYWKDLVHIDSITVQLQSIGSYQEVIVEKWDDEKIFLLSKDSVPIDCFYHVYAERKDVNALIVEYEGKEWSDYPDKNYDDPQYSNKVNTKTL